MMKGQSSPHQVAVVVLLYWTASISMVFVNKYLLSGNFVSSDLSIFVACYQSWSAVGVIQLVRVVSSYLNLSCNVPTVEVQCLLQSDILRMSFAFVMSLTLNNLMLKHISLPFYQVARSFTLIFTIVFSNFMLKKPITVQAVLASLLVVCGYVIGIDQENDIGTLSVWGIIYGLLASLTSAYCGICIKRSEVVMEGSSFKQAYYNNLNSAVIFLPLMFSSGQLKHVLSSDSSSSISFWVYLTLSGMMSLTMSWVSALQIKYTSPVTHHISINAKSVMQTVLAILYFQEHKTGLWWIGNFCVIMGVLLYALSKAPVKRETLDVDGLLSSGHAKHTYR